MTYINFVKRDNNSIWKASTAFLKPIIFSQQDWEKTHYKLIFATIRGELRFYTFSESEGFKRMTKSCYKLEKREDKNMSMNMSRNNDQSF